MGWAVSGSTNQNATSDPVSDWTLTAMRHAAPPSSRIRIWRCGVASPSSRTQRSGRPRSTP